jgi:raffinose/stachyose/melibiose transport system permease protein
MYRNKRVIALLVFPGLAMFFAAIFVPICLSIFYSFTNYSGLGDFKFVRLSNYLNLLKDGAFRNALKNSLFLAIALICIQHPLAMITAALLDKLSGKRERFFRCIYFIPNVISVAVIAYMWKIIYNPNYGLLTKMLRTIGVRQQINWLGTGNAIWSVIVVLIWHGFGWAMLIYYAGIKNIDVSLYEAAVIDGCDDKRSFLHITLPLMKPIIKVNVTLAVISALKQMETVYLLTNGGPGNSTMFLANYVYQQAFNAFRYGYANAISVDFVATCLIATFAINWIFKEREKPERKLLRTVLRGAEV